MPIVAFILLLTSSICQGIMAILRKRYQVINGTTMTATLFFTLFISSIGGLAGLLMGEGLHIDAVSLKFAFAYAFISTVTASICIYATAFGNVSTLLIWALLGKLVLSSAFGIITQPVENSLTVYKTVGFLAAMVCIAIDFIADRRHKKSNIRFKILCAVVFFTNGSALIIFNLKNRFCEGISNMNFVAEYMFFSVLLAGMCLLVISLKNKSAVKNMKYAMNKKSVITMLLYAIIFLTAEIMALKCAGIIPLMIQAPVSFAIPIITTAVIDYFSYKVKLNKFNVVQLIFAFLCCMSFMLER